MFAFPFPRTTHPCVLICLLLISSMGAFSVVAQPSDPDELKTNARPSAPLAATQKSPGLAVFSSAAATTVLGPVVGIGLVIGPSLGHYYAENERQARNGIQFRMLSLEAAALGGVLALGTPFGWVLLKMGAVATGASVLYDTVTAWHAATDFNESHGISAQVTPTVDSGGKQVGLALRMSF